MVVKVFNEQAGRPNCFDTSILQQFEVKGVREGCPLCKGTFQGRPLLLRHLSDTHFRDRICAGIPDHEGVIYKCPQCSHAARDRQAFVRHYGMVYKMVIKYLNEMGIHSLDEDRKSTPASPAAQRQYSSFNESFSPRSSYNEPMRSPSYYSPQTPQPPAYRSSHEIQQQQQQPHYPPQFTSPTSQYVSPVRSAIASPEDLSPASAYSRAQGYSQFQQPQAHAQEHHYGQPQDLSSNQPQDLTLALPQDLSKPSQPLDFSNNGGQHIQQPKQIYHQPGTSQLPQSTQYTHRQQLASNHQSVITQNTHQKQLQSPVLVNDPYRQQPATPMQATYAQPMTPQSQHSNPGTPQAMSQPGTPQPPPPPSPASYNVPTPQPQYSTVAQQQQDYYNNSNPIQTSVIQQKAPQPHHVQQTQHAVILQPGHQQVIQTDLQGNSSASPTKKVNSDYTPTGDEHIEPPEPGSKGPYGIFCYHCNTVKARQPSDFYRHLSESHYKSILAQGLPPVGQPPYTCPLCPYENKEMSPMIRHYGVAHKKVKEAIGNQKVGKYIPESEIAPSRPKKAIIGGPIEPQRYTHQPPAQVLDSSPPSSSQQIQVRCPFSDCEMDFSARYAFWQHMCDKHLKETLLKHLPPGSQPFQCPHPGCNYVTKDSRQSLVRHYGMTHKIVQELLRQIYPDFLNTDPFAPPPKTPKTPRARSKSITPVRVDGQQQQYGQQYSQPPQQHYAQHPPIQHHQPQQHPQQPQYQPQVVDYSAHHQQQTYQQQQFNQFDLNLDSLNPSDFSIPSLDQFLDPGTAFPNISGVDLSDTGYVTAQGHTVPSSHANMRFEPQIDGTFDPTS